MRLHGTGWGRERTAALASPAPSCIIWTLNGHGKDNRLWRKNGTFPAGKLKDGRLVREVKTRDFKSALLLINAVGYEAERMNHHPEILNVYRTTVFSLWTHDADAVTEKDAALARAINALLDE